MRFLAITTTRVRDERLAAPTLTALREQRCEVVLVVREADQDAVQKIGLLHRVTRRGSYGLSAARNVGLAYAREQGLIGGNQVVFFPDEDNVPLPDLLASVAQALVNHPDAVGVLGAYKPDGQAIDRGRFPAMPSRVTRKTAETLATSNTMYLRASTMQRLGCFDERFGLGAPFGAAEDMDLVLRAIRLGPMYYEPAIVTQHPYKTNLFARNYPGSVAVKVKNKDYGGAARLIGYGLKRIVRRDLTAAALGRGVIMAGRCITTSPVPKSSRLA